MTETDLELLKRYARDHAEDAFAEIVRRHLDLVHSAALRQVRSQQLAEEVAQSAFTDLARNAAKLIRGGDASSLGSLTPWLYQVTRRTAIDVVRREARRQLRERIATEMNTMNATAADWTHIEPLLDDAMAALDETDRAAVLLRYFENKSLREVGATLGTSDDAAQKRVSRAVERLREFFAKRGVTVGAGGLVVVISANAIQAAPAGLAVTISTTATLTGTTLATTATNAIAMTTLQKSIIGATIAAAVGTGIYETHQASKLRDQVQILQQQQAPLTDRIQQAQRERDEANRQLAMLCEENERLNRNTAELLRLRGEVALLRNDSKDPAMSRTSGSSDSTESAAKSWSDRVTQLKQRLAQLPDAGIPELEFATEEDWLNAARGDLKTEADYRRALSTLRGAAEGKFARMIQRALKNFMKGNSGQMPMDIVQLQPFFDTPVSDAVLQRWEVAPATTVKSLGMGGDVIITQKRAVDDVFDNCYGIGPNGLGTADFLSRSVGDTMKPVWEAFQAAHNGKWPDDVSELQPYAGTQEQQAALQKLMLKQSFGR